MPMAIGCSTHVTHVLQPITGKTQWRATQNLVTWQESTGIRGHVTWCASSNPHVVSCDKFTLLQSIYEKLFVLFLLYYAVQCNSIFICKVTKNIA
ncbi:hypothetical protein HUJ05_003217 [Dendroctonus ponderosae]|nr:hypothetical protein HUJ05_003217 [Dendroctonus ponderosae]